MARVKRGVIAGRRHKKVLKKAKGYYNARRKVFRVAKQAELAKVGYEKVLANLRELSEMMVKSNSEAFGVINKRVTEALDEVKHSVANGKVNGKHR